MPFHAFLSTWVGSAWGNLEVWKAWKEWLLVLLTVPLSIWMLRRPRRFRQLLRDPLAWWILAFVGILVFLTILNVGSNGRDASLAGLASTGRYFLIFVLAYTLFFYGHFLKPQWTKLRDVITKYLVIIGVVVSIIGIMQVHVLPLDFLSNFGYDKNTTIAPYTVIDENLAAPRAFATLRGPNDFAAYLIVPLILSLLLTRSNKRWLLASGVITIGLFESSSRSAWIGAIVAIITLLLLLHGRTILFSRKAKLTVAGTLVAIIVVLTAAASIPSVRLEVFHSSPNDTSLTEGSTSNHWRATSAGIMRVIQHPLGCGAGCAGPASYYGPNPKISESYLVQIAEETGISGLILWLGIAVMVLSRLWRQQQDSLALALFVGFVGLSVVSLTLHTWADDPLSLTWWVLAGATLGYYAPSRYDKQK